MGNKQFALAIASLALVLILFFAFDTTPVKNKNPETSGSSDKNEGILLAHIDSAMQSLGPVEENKFRTLTNIVLSSCNDSIQNAALEELRQGWLDRRDYLSAGYFASKHAESAMTADKWSTTGSIYSLALADSATASGQREVAFLQAVSSFEKAISLDPMEIEYRVSLALCYVEHPPEDNPMKGIQSLLRLSEQSPENTSVQFHLARFGLATGQVDKAIERLEYALELQPGETRLHCLIAQAYRMIDDLESAAEHAAKCEED